MSAIRALERMLAAGVPLETAIEIAKQFEADVTEHMAALAREMARDHKAEARKAKDAERKRVERASKPSEDIQGHPTPSKDEPDAALTCAQVVNTTSSLRSEDKPRLPSGVSPAKPKPSRSRLVPDSWSPGPKLLADLAEIGFTPGEIERELANFRDHEFRDPKSDFDRTFRRWMRQSQNFQPRKAHDRTDHPATSRAARRGVWAEVLAEERGEGPGRFTGTG